MTFHDFLIGLIGSGTGFWENVRAPKNSGQFWNLDGTFGCLGCKAGLIILIVCNVGIAIISHPPYHHFYGWYKPSKIGGLLLLYLHYDE